MSTKELPKGKLTGAMRQTVQEAMVRYAMGSRIADAKAALAQLCVERLQTPQRLALPRFLIDDKWINMASTCTVYWYENSKQNRWSDYDHIELPLELPVRRLGRYDDSDLTVHISLKEEPDDLILKAWQALQGLTTEKRELENTISKVLASVNTAAQLVELLPEARDFLPDPQRPESLVPVGELAKLRSVFAARS